MHFSFASYYYKTGCSVIIDQPLTTVLKQEEMQKSNIHNKIYCNVMNLKEKRFHVFRT